MAPAPAALLLVVPTLDSHLLLPRLVESLQRQSLQAWQVLFIDGPSAPPHRAYLQELCAADRRFRWVRQHGDQPGIFGAMNQGFSAAQPGQWLLFWGSDDWAAGPDVLEQALAAIAAAPQPPDLVVCAGRYATLPPVLPPAGAPQLGRRTAFRWRHNFRRSLFLGSTPPHQATWIGPGARRRLARYAEGFRLAADLDYFLQLSRFNDLAVLPLPLELVHMATDGVSGVQHRRRLQEVRRAYRRAFGLWWWAPFLLRYLQRLQSVARAAG
ncbi:glycosyltransferase [Synechococcus sp. ATX 2A4]|uniref:glycosyltransferase n=1 Tax=Synechococcus sp. ATX 2A4 TaxID=2823727 RepID=UPI0020CE652C|nr:glycosyltransferase [Synechococcus sp. ATX 2A4]MCP9884184.1 glycosyltransferase [Synechococcus sp. ATX 2A4]